MPESSTPSNNLRDRMIAVDVVNHSPHTIDEEGLARAVRMVCQRFRVLRARIDVAVVDDAAITAVHREYLGQDTPTDVITFPHSAPDAEELCGEIIVSADTALREAAARGLPTAGELALYVIHGALHLVGLDDRTAGQAAAMRRWEQSLMESLGFPYEFDGRTSAARESP